MRRVGRHFAVCGLVVDLGSVEVYRAASSVVEATFVFFGVCVFYCCRTIFAVFFARACTVIASWRWKISSSVSNTSSSSSGYISCNGVMACNLEVDACNCCRTVTHLVVPSMSSIFFSLFLVLSTELQS